MKAQSNLPLRGMAMILIAVAILLAAWGAFVLSRGDDAEPTAAPETTVAEAPASTPTSTPAPAPTSESAPPAEQVRVVHVLNNSTTPGLAAQVAEDVRGRGWETGEVGNYNTSVVPQTTVYFTPGNEAAEQAARTLAEQMGAVAEPRPADLPAETHDENTIVLVLAG